MKDMIGLTVLALAALWLLWLIFMIVRDVLSDRAVARTIKARESIAKAQAGAPGGAKS